MKKIILMLTLSMLFIGCKSDKDDFIIMNKFDYYFPNNGNVYLTIESAADTLIVQKVNTPVTYLSINENVSENSSKRFQFNKYELVNTVKSDLAEVTISSDQIKIVIKESDVAYDRKVHLGFDGPGTSDGAVQTVGDIVITQKAKP